MATDKIKVAVRVRPFSRRELELGTQCVVEMEGQQTILHNPVSLDKIERKQPKTFAFDHCFYSLDPDSSIFASQEDVFNSVGRDILENAFEGYNACIFAYGQTGSGKSYTMMGSQDNKGIIPRLCDELFASMVNNENPDLLHKVEVSYMEIYNEKVHDLLDPKQNKQSLKVREHNVLGPYVDGLSQLAVASFQDIDNLMTEGNKSRTVAATNMNAESSRSHAVFSVVLTQILSDPHTGVSGEKVSRMSLVDLAGSERAVKTGAVGDRLKEGSNINKSLTTLGLVISKLADQSSGRNRNDKFVPYRDSVLTWLLKDNLGGNSKTVMVATISPAADNYEETLSTLRYADRAKRIVNHAVVNEDPNARIIRELRLEVEALRNMLKHATGSPVGEVDIHDKLAESENLMKQISQTWEEKLVKTERIQNERQQALEKMGISVQASGIKVEKNKYYLVNLNADPSLNELLVYYLKERTLVGGHNVNQEPDIQLSGLGIQPEHCIIVIEDGGLFLEPIQNARCFVNGSPAFEKTALHHGDRILWGNHHFFRVNCPKSANNMNLSSEPQTPAQQIDYNFARDEIMQNELSNDPIQAAIARLEKQHEEDKQVALEKQKQEFEKQFQQLRSILSPNTPYAPYAPYDIVRLGKITPSAQERDEMFKRSLGQLKADIMRANSLVQEANFLAEEMEKKTKFSVTLQIPPAKLSPNRKRGAFASEPAILVKRVNFASQVWSMEKLEYKLIDMREMYQEHKERAILGLDEISNKSDPFYESQEKHHLIGVANLFLEVLFHDVTLDYHTPIISQQGEVAGRLQVEIVRTAGKLPQDRMCESTSDSSTDSRDDDYNMDPMTNHITCRVTIKQATGLPPSLSNFVFCKYTFWGHDETVVPAVNSDPSSPTSSSGVSSANTSNISNNSSTKTINVSPGVLAPVNPNTPSPTASNQSKIFDHSIEYTVAKTEEFLEHCADGALSIEVWGNRSAGFSKSKGWEVEQQQAKARSLVDRWAELSRKIELWVEIHELNDNGEYAPVEVTNRGEVLTGGVYQLRQGQQRRILVRVKPVQNSGTLPIIVESIASVEVGSITVRSKLQKPLDSYQEEDLKILSTKWSDALSRRRNYLEQQIQKLLNKENKTEEEREREISLVHQWVSLTEECNAVLLPAPGSGIPGAPAQWDPPPGMEPHVPVLFLNLNADDLTAQNTNNEIAGLNSILSKEYDHKFYALKIVHRPDRDVCAIASWDSSLHDDDSQHLNRVTETNNRIYLILKTIVCLSHPARMDLVLRKRLCLNINKRQSITDKLKKLRLIRTENSITQSGVTYEVVSNVPKASEELEDRETLAQLAASGDDCSAIDGETYIEKYTRSVSAVESILALDRLRQNVAVKELEQAQGQALSMRKTVSVPNFSQIMRFDASLESLRNVGRSESYADLQNPDYGGGMNRSFAIDHQTPFINNVQNTRDFPGIVRTRHSFAGKGTNDEAPVKPFGLASPAGGKLMGLRMTTLHEEPLGQRTLAEEPEDTYSDPEYDADYEYEKTTQIAPTRSRLTGSKTMDSLMEISSSSSNNHHMTYTSVNTSALKHVTGLGTPSMSSSTSSGYGSQAVSCSNLTNDDTLSLRSISVDETPDKSTMGSGESTATTSTTPFTPNSRQKRFNPFMKDLPNIDKNEIALKQQQSQNHQNTSSPFPPGPTGNNIMKQQSPLTPTKEHPLKDLTEGSRSHETGDYMQNQKNNNSSTVKPEVIQDTMCEKQNNQNKLHGVEESTQDKDYPKSDVENDENKNLIPTDEKIDDNHNRRSRESSITSNESNELLNNGKYEKTTIDTPIESFGIVKGQLPPGKVVRRKKLPAGPGSSNGNIRSNSLNRASLNLTKPESLTKSTDKLDIANDSGSMERLEDDSKHHHETAVPDWVVVGESVLIRPYNTSGVISFVGPTHFQPGTWVGVELDTPTGKNDGSVNNIQYFNCKQKYGIFVRWDKLILDKRGRAMRAFKAEKISKSIDGTSITRSRSRGESLNTLGATRK